MSEPNLILDWLLDRELDVPFYVTPWGTAKMVDWRTLKAFQRGGVALTWAELCVVWIQLYELDLGWPDARIAAVAKVRRARRAAFKARRRKASDRRRYRRQHTARLVD